MRHESETKTTKSSKDRRIVCIWFSVLIQNFLLQAIPQNKSIRIRALSGMIFIRVPRCKDQLEPEMSTQHNQIH